jgi:hypothetical protein
MLRQTKFANLRQVISWISHLFFSGLGGEKNVRPPSSVGGHAVRIGDCYVWAAIEYLDSASDYRECIAARRTFPRR